MLRSSKVKETQHRSKDGNNFPHSCEGYIQPCTVEWDTKLYILYLCQSTIIPYNLIICIRHNRIYTAIGYLYPAKYNMKMPTHKLKYIHWYTSTKYTVHIHTYTSIYTYACTSIFTCNSALPVLPQTRWLEAIRRH